MIPCRCDRCCPENPAPTYTEAFKLDCLARFANGMPTLEARREWLAKVERERGAGFTQRLKETMRRLWNLKEADAGSGPAAAVTQHADKERMA